MSVGCLLLEVFWAHPAVRACIALYCIVFHLAVECLGFLQEELVNIAGEKIVSGLAKELQLGNSGES